MVSMILKQLVLIVVTEVTTYAVKEILKAYQKNRL
jgi:hypothetical protein